MGRKPKKPENVPFPPIEEMEQLSKDIQKYGDRKELKSISAPPIIGILGEFFESYMVFAYDSDGNQFLLRKVDNPRDMRAINGLIEDYIDHRIEMVHKDDVDELENWMRRMEEEDDDGDEDPRF